MELENATGVRGSSGRFSQIKGLVLVVQRTGQLSDSSPARSQEWRGRIVVGEAAASIKHSILVTTVMTLQCRHLDLGPLWYIDFSIPYFNHY